MPMRSARRGRRPRRQPDLPARLRGRLEQDDRVAALGRDARRLQAGRPGAHDDDPSGADRSLGTASCGIVSSRPVAGLWMHSAVEPDVDPVDAVRRPDARPDPVRLARLELADDVRVGHVRPHHPDHVDEPLGDGVAGGRDVRDPGRVEDRQVDPLAEPAGELERRPERRPEPRDDVGDAPRRSRSSP